MTDLTRFTNGSIAGRQAALPGPLRGLHRAVLRRFLDTGAPPTERWVRQAAADHGLDAAALDQLDAADAVHIVNGVVAVAYPLSGTPHPAPGLAGRAARGVRDVRDRRARAARHGRAGRPDHPRSRHNERLRPTLADLLPAAARIAGLTAQPDRWASLKTRTEAAYVRQAQAGDWPDVEDRTPGELALVCRPNLDVYSGLAGLYRTRHGNLRADSVATVLGRALARGRQRDDELWFAPGRFPRRTSWPPATATPPASASTSGRNRCGTCGSTAPSGRQERGMPPPRRERPETPFTGPVLSLRPAYPVRMRPI